MQTEYHFLVFKHQLLVLFTGKRVVFRQSAHRGGKLFAERSSYYQTLNSI
ncbi:MAG: hypothetical protein V7606_594 [Burkholderiales bacterium]